MQTIPFSNYTVILDIFTSEMRATTGERRRQEKQLEISTFSGGSFLLSSSGISNSLAEDRLMVIEPTTFISKLLSWRCDNKQRQERKRRNKGLALLKTYHVIFRTERVVDTWGEIQISEGNETIPLCH